MEISHPIPTSAAITCHKLTVSRGMTRVLSGIDAEIATSQITGLLGPSGNGKSTLLRSIVGVQNVASGTVEVLGQPAGSRCLRRDVAYMTQDASVYEDLSVADNLSYFARILDVDQARIAEVVDDTDLTRVLNHKVANLSGGQRNRVSLAAALLGSPRVMVLDEPTVGLDPLLRESLWALFRKIADSGVTLLVSSHVMDEASRCDQLLLMYEGRIVASDTPAGIRKNCGNNDLDACFVSIIRSLQSEEVA